VTKPITRAERKREELRREIIDAAFERFAESGYHATGIADIATHLGIGHGTFYRYFENKRDIIDHVVDDVIGRIMTALSAENAPDAPTSLAEYRAQVGRVSDALTAILLDDPRVPQLLLFEATGIDVELTDRLYGLLDMADAMTVEYFRHGVEAGYLRTDLDVVNSARALTGMMMANIIHGIRNSDPAAIRALNLATQRLMFDGISAD